MVKQWLPITLSLPHTFIFPHPSTLQALGLAPLRVLQNVFLNFFYGKKPLNGGEMAASKVRVMDIL